MELLNNNKGKHFLPHIAIRTSIHPAEAFRGESGNGLVGDWIDEPNLSPYKHQAKGERKRVTCFSGKCLH